MSVLGTVAPDQQPGEPVAVATTGSSGSRRPLLLVLLGVLVLLGGVAGYLLTSGFFEEPQQVLVAAVDIPRGATVSAGDLAGARLDLGGIPHIAWSPMAVGALSGLVALAPIPAGAVVHGDLFFDPAAAPSGEDLEVIVPLDTSLVPTPPQRGDLVLLVDPGAPPAEGDPGRPRQVFQWLELRDFDGSSMRMFVPPAEWARWRDVHTALGSAPQVLPVPLGGDPEAMARSLNEVWAAEWEAAAQLVEASLPAAPAGWFRVSLPLDAAGVAGPIREGDLVLIVDPGRPAQIDDLGLGDPGRPPSVIESRVLDGWDGGVATFWAPPDRWAYYTYLPQRLGATPVVLPVNQPAGRELDASEVRELVEAVDAAFVRWTP